MVRWYRVAPVISSPQGTPISPSPLVEEGGVRGNRDNRDQYIPPETSSQQKRTVPKWTWGFFSKRKVMEEVQESETKHCTIDFMVVGE